MIHLLLAPCWFTKPLSHTRCTGADGEAAAPAAEEEAEPEAEGAKGEKKKKKKKGADDALFAALVDGEEPKAEEAPKAAPEPSGACVSVKEAVGECSMGFKGFS